MTPPLLRRRRQIIAESGAGSARGGGIVTMTEDVVGRREVADTRRGADGTMGVIVIPHRMTNRGRDDIGSIGGSMMIMMERRAGRAGIEITK